MFLISWNLTLLSFDNSDGRIKGKVRKKITRLEGK